MESPLVASEAVEIAEREMSANQRGLVDTCFEEGQYETGIYVLDSLRSPKTKPAVTHIRQLLYLALYPPPAGEIVSNAAPDANLPVSPSKLGAKQQRSALMPTEAASLAACRLLEAFTSTNNPGALLRALPSHPIDSPNVTRSAPKAMSQDDDDSFLSRQSRSIKESRHCWEIFREGFVKPYKDATSAAPQASNRKRQGGASQGASSSDENEEQVRQPSAVASHAWPVLKWLLSTIEKEESLSESTDQPRHSPFLVSQLLPPRTVGDRRWDASSTLEIVVHCIEEEDPQKQSLGIRLLHSLINLTATNLVDLPAFLTATFHRLRTIPKPTLASLLSMFPQSSLALQFKLAFCKHMLIGTSSASGKARPKPRARTTRSNQNGSSSTPSSTQPNGDDSQNTSGSGSATPYTMQLYPPVTSADVLNILETPTTDPKTVVDTLRIQYELVLTFASIQSQANSNIRDAAWVEMLSSSRLATVIERTFVHAGRSQSEDAKDVDMMRNVLLAITQAGTVIAS